MKIDQATLDLLHEPIPGHRGVSSTIAALHDEMAALGLCEAGHDVISRHVVRQLPSVVRTVHYTPGGPSTRSTYRQACIVPEKAYIHATVRVPSGLRSQCDALVTAPAPDERQEWRYNGVSRRWVKVRRWKVGDGHLRARPIRLGAYRITLAKFRSGYTSWTVSRMAGHPSDTRSRRVAWAERTTPSWRKCGAHAAIAIAIRKHLRRKETPAVRVRDLAHLCPPNWTARAVSVITDGWTAPAYVERSTGEVYHPDESRTPVADAREAFASRAEVREQLLLLELVEAGRAEGVSVCLRDSTDAGNCRVGTVEWAKEHDLDVSRHYSAADMLALANGEARQVRAAIICAIRRRQQESRQGFCRVN